jgi:hypothetical protein
LASNAVFGPGRAGWSLFRLAAAAAILALAGCGGSKPAAEAGGGQLPAWVNSPPSAPGKVHAVGSAPIVAGGEGRAISQAKEAARLELMKQLRVTVSGTTESRTRQEVAGGESQLTRSLREAVRSQVPEVRLEGLRIQETFAHEASDSAYALAQLDRAQAEMRLTNRIGELDERLAGYTGKGQSGSRLERLQALMPAMPLLEKRRKLNERLRLVSEQGRGEQLPQELGALEDRILELLDRVRVTLKAEGETARQMESELVRRLTEAGIKAEAGTGGDLHLRYAADLRSRKHDGTHYVTATGRVSVTDGSGRILTEFNAKEKGGSGDPGLARDRAIAELAEALGSQLGRRLLDSL